MAIDYRKQLGSDLAFAPSGTKGNSTAALVTGAYSGQMNAFDWEAVRQTMMNNNTSYITWFDHFLGDSVNTTYAPNLSTGATAAINAQTSGVVRLTTDTDDDDFATLTLGLHWLVSNGWTYFESKVKSVTAITLRAIEVGLSDALSETGGLAFSNHSAAVVDVADDAAIFGYDTDASMTTWAVNTVKAGTPAATVLTAAPSTSFQKLAIAINSSGDAYFYVDNALVATHLLAVSTTAVLTPWISLKSLSAATKSIDVDYLFVGGNA